MPTAYRRDARLNGAVTFGMNVIVTAGLEQVLLRVGQPVAELRVRLSRMFLAAGLHQRAVVSAMHRALFHGHAFGGFGLHKSGSAAGAR